MTRSKRRFMSKISDTARKIPRLFVQLLTHPGKTIKSKTDRLFYLGESLRMRIVGSSIFRRKRDLAEASSCPIAMIRKARDMWNPRSVVDVGCGAGKASDFWRELGTTEVIGVEGSRTAIEANSRPDLIVQADLSRPLALGRKFDLVYTVEVAEHIHPALAAVFVRNLVSLGDRILITAARPGQGGLGHLNEREPEYWEALFEAEGCRRNRAAESEIKKLGDMYHENLMVYEKS
jgi:SAM-dependent methyltransferase